MQEFTIERLGKKNITFQGELIGQSAGANPAIKIYRTKAGQFVGQAGPPSLRASDADHFDKPETLVDWLKTQLGEITPVAQIAIEDAVNHDPTFKEFWTEKVE